MDKPIPEAVLLPCPMCGSDAALNTCRTTESEFIRLNGRDTGYGVNCVTCGLNNRGFAYGYATPAEAITAWNRRACVSSATEALRAEVERLRMGVCGDACLHIAIERDQLKARAERLAEALREIQDDALRFAAADTVGGGLDAMQRAMARLAVQISAALEQGKGRG